MTFQPDTRVLGLFVKWIEQFDKQHARNWARLYKSDPQAAMCEATFWGLLSDCGVEVTPNADLRGVDRRPDFLCHKSGTKFYVEVTCIRVDKVERETALPHCPQEAVGAQSYGDLNRVIFWEAKNKTPQCANLDAPCILGIGTFHFQASCLCGKKYHLEELLTGKQAITYDMDMRKGEAVGDPYLSTSLRAAAFIRWDKGTALEYARCPVSALLIGGFGCKPPEVCGLLHPKPAREFDRALLANIDFGRLQYDSRCKQCSVTWC